MSTRTLVELGRWIRTERYLLANALLLFATIAVALIPSSGQTVRCESSDLRLRLWALSLQMLGAWIAAYDLVKAARQSGHRGIWRGLQERAALALSANRSKSIQLSGRGSVQTNASGTLSPLRYPVDSSLPLETRLENLARNFSQLEQETASLRRELGEKHDAAKEWIAEETRKRNAAVGDLSRRLKDAALGNLAPLVFGAAWLAVGTIMASVSPEIACVAAPLWRAVLQSL